MPASSIVTLSKIVAERRCIDNEYVFSHFAISSGVIHLEKSLAPIASLILVRFELDLASCTCPGRHAKRSKAGSVSFSFIYSTEPAEGAERDMTYSNEAATEQACIFAHAQGGADEGRGESGASLGRRRFFFAEIGRGAAGV